LISPYYVSLEDDVMCFIIFSLTIPTRQILTEFDVILPYPSPAKIDGIYDEILTLWNPTEQSTQTTTLLFDSQLSLYFDSLLLTPHDSPSTSAPPSSAEDELVSSSSPLRYDLYVSTFQFQYSPALMGSNVSSSLLASQSESIFTQVTSMLYDERMDNQTAIATPSVTSSIQQLRAETNTDDPCGYEMIDHSLHNVSHPQPAFFIISCATE
jgi:hypothetical protein